MADAGGAFVTRAFEKLLKDSNHRKFAKLQQALKAYLDRPKDNVFFDYALNDDAAAKDGQAPAPVGGGEAAEVPPGSEPSTETQADDEAAQQQSSANVNAAATMAEAGHSLEGYEAEIIIMPLRLAIETKQSKLIETALDCLHKLVAYGHLEGEAGIEGGRNSVLMTELFQLVCNCADNTAVDSVVLQVIKVILTAVASTTFNVHGECLVLAIRTCYNIVLNSKNQVNLITAKGTLTQMINIVFKRMEAAELGQEEPHVVRQYARIEHPFSPAMDRPAGSASLDAAPIPMPALPPVGEAAEAPPASVSAEDIQMMAGESNIRGLEAALGQAVGPVGGDQENKGIKLETLAVSQRDALLVFRTLCKMAMKEGNEDLISRTKILSLELLQGLLESVSHEFTLNFAFIDSIKMYLCYALVRAYVSPLEKVFQLACSIFAVLILRFRESLKAEIGLFFPLVVLRSLDSADSPLNQRTTVLKMLEGVTNDPQMLADVFVNYDCDLEATNLFERMVNSLSRIAQGMPTGDPNSIILAQNTSLKASSLQCLVNVLASLVAWSQKDQVQIEEVEEASQEGSKGQDKGDVVSKEEATEASRAIGTQADVFTKAKAHKSTIEAAVTEFNMKPEKGVTFLESHKLVDREPAAIAKFLRTTPGLSKTLVGDYLGEFDEFHVAVMHAYVDSMSFQGLMFDQAIRDFLKGFRLPGEAQKIDRIMEKFAERYCRDNPGIFKTADTAYVLAYAVIMLNTDAHNPVVTSKMTKADFVRINSGTDSEEGAPVALLEEIYDSIVQNEIKLKEDGLTGSQGPKQAEEKGSLLAVLNLATPRKKVLADTKLESEEIVKRTQTLVKSQGAKRWVFHTATHAELGRPMLEAVGWPLLAAFSVTMEDSESKPRVSLCMEGFRWGVHLTKQLGMETMRYALLTSLVRFTFLHAPKEMRTKNVEALRTLLSMAESEPDALQDTWNAVLECISRLEHITSTPALSSTLMAMNNQLSREALLASLVELAGKPSEQVFANSQHLPSDQVVEFFTALCGVSAEELRHVPARVFSLQKLVEMSYYNMARIRMVWARIWSVLSAHFVAAGGHPDQKIAMYAIDSLRQLAMKYLERAELANFTFQNDILKPFVVIMRRSKNGQIRELIVQCVVQMIKTKVASIKSGWKSVFMVLTTAAADNMETTVESSFENVELVVLEHFEQVVGDCFMDCVNCLIAFANNKVSPRISLKAIALLRICEDRLAEGRIPGGASRPVNEGGKTSDTEVAEFYWFPMLAGLSDLASDPRLEVRNCALEVLFDLLRERGHSFSTKFWESVFERVLFPIFDYVRHAGSDGEKPTSADVWLLETAINCLHMLCDLFCSFYQAVSFMLPNLLSLLLDCATRPDQRLASIAIGALLRLMDTGGSQFDQKDWALVLDSIRMASVTTRPMELLSADSFSAETPVNPSVSLVPKSQIPRGDEAAHLFDPTNPKAEPAVEEEETRTAKDETRTEEDKTGEEAEGGGGPTGGEESGVGRNADGEGEVVSGVEGKERKEGKENGGSKGGDVEGEEAEEGPERKEGEEEGRAAAIIPEPEMEPSSEFRVPDVEVSPSPADPRAASPGLFGGNALGKTLMGSMMDTLLMKNLSQKAKVPSQPAVGVAVEVPPPAEPVEEVASGELEEELTQVLDSVRSKGYVQLLLLSALHHLQSKHWFRLRVEQKREVLDQVQAMVEFAAAYDSDQNLRARMLEVLGDRPPPSLLRQEVAGTQLYLTTLLRAMGDTAGEALPPPLPDTIPVETGAIVHKFTMAKGNRTPPAVAPKVHPHDPEGEAQLREEAAGRLLRFCQKILESSATLQPNSGEAVEAEIHRALALRAPVVAKVLLTLSVMNGSIFDSFVGQIYPSCTRLICSDQMEVRKALGELFKARFVAKLP